MDKGPNGQIHSTRQGAIDQLDLWVVDQEVTAPDHTTGQQKRSSCPASAMGKMMNHESTMQPQGRSSETSAARASKYLDLHVARPPPSSLLL
ncbi:hypothetical protein E4U35_006224, partial [Claviceps purpurea]